jgi:ubiquinone/menaquinone biosynthesis C-methylase UbiE
MKKTSDSSWENVENWYHNQVGEKGHYYHQTVILPGVLKHLTPANEGKLLDLACGQGVLARQISPQMAYVGVDLSPSLIRSAQNLDKKQNHRYLVGDVSKPLALKEKDFTFGAILLALQNIENPVGVFKNFYNHLLPGSKVVIVLNHPCFRIPRQSSWGVDESKKLQYRRIDRYLSTLKIPIQAHPGQQDKSVSTLSFHYSLSSLSGWLKEAGFLIETIEEWCSDKKSTGKAATMENRARSEFPLFMAIVGIKK